MITIKTPIEYINQPDIHLIAGRYIKKYGKNALIIGSKTSLEVIGTAFFENLKEEEIQYEVETFLGYPTFVTMKAYAKKAEERKADVIIGIGGGKVCDTAKAAGTFAKLPVITIPTIAATCASWAAVSIVYNEKGQVEVPFSNDNSPVLLLADTKIIAQAPSKYMYAGIVDTLAKWYETIPNLTIAPKDTTLSISLYGAKLAFDSLLKQGKQAVLDGQQGLVTKEVFDTIDAILYLAGFVGSFQGDTFYGGFAHPFYNSSTLISKTMGRLHGEKVSIGLLAQYILEKRSDEEIRELIHVLDKFHLALTLEEIGIQNEEETRIIAKDILKRFSNGYKQLSIAQTENEIVKALWQADAIVKQTLKTKVLAGRY